MSTVTLDARNGYGEILADSFVESNHGSLVRRINGVIRVAATMGAGLMDEV